MYPNGTCKYIKNGYTETGRSATKGQQIIMFGLLCLMSMDFQTRFFYFAFILFGMTILIQKLHFELPQAVFPALILAVSMCMFSPSTKGWALGMIRPFAYPLCVVAGYNFVKSDSREETEQLIKGILIALAVGAYSHYFLNMMFNWGKITDRNTIDVWTKSILSATGQSSLACVMVGVSIPILFMETKRRYKLVFAAVLISIAYYNLMLGGRTLFLLMIVLLVFNLAAEIIKNKDPLKRTKIILVVLLAAAAVFAIIQFDLFGVREIFYNSTFFKRFYVESSGDSFTEDGRMSFKLMYLQNMLSYPLGGKELYNAVGKHYAHDIYLDTYSDSGALAFIAVLIMMITYIARTIHICVRTDTDGRTKKMLINIMIVVVIIFSTEPILDATPWLFASFCVLYGAIVRLIEFNVYQEQGAVKHAYS